MSRDSVGGTDDARPAYIILGATGGIGRSLAGRLARRGARLAVAGRDPEQTAALAEEVGGLALVIASCGFAEIQSCFERTTEWAGKIDGAANCIGSLHLKPAHLTGEDEFRNVMDTNAGSAFATVHAAAQAMRFTGGSVVLVSSAAARIGLASHEAIAAAKAAVLGLTISAAATYAPVGIRVNAVAPGLTRTPMTERLTSNEASLRASASMHALGRIGEPDEVAAAIDWLLGSESAWVTGQVIGVDGGLATVRSRGGK